MGIQRNIIIMVMYIIKTIDMTYIFRCHVRSSYHCPGRIYSNEALEIEEYYHHVLHPIEEDFLERHEFRKEIYRLCETTYLPLNQIFNDVTLRYLSLSPSLSPSISFSLLPSISSSLCLSPSLRLSL